MSVDAANYIGAMQLSSGYTLENVRVTLDEKGTITLYHVKFARMMPVRVDLLIPHVKCRLENNRTILRGDSIIPMVADKPHPDRLIKDLHGRIEGETFIFRCKIGNKELYYRGMVTNQPK